MKQSLLKVRPQIKDDYEAIQIAFTEIISGRSPEKRGNGLKFVLRSIIENKWSMFYQSGNAVCIADQNGFYFEKSNYIHKGCFCIISKD